MKRTWITVKRGILEPKHRFALGELIYLFLFILDITGWETGIIEEWSDKGVAEEMDMPLPTLVDQRRKLQEKGYISCERKQHGIRVIVHNWTNPREYTGKKYNEKIPINTPINTPTFKDTPTFDVSSYNQKSQITNQKSIEDISGKPEPNLEPCDEDGVPDSWKEKPKGSKSHPAIIAFREVAHKYPNKILYDTVIDILGPSPDIPKMEKCYQEWIARGYNASSIKWLDWYAVTIPNRKGDNKFAVTMPNDEFYDVIKR